MRKLLSVENLKVAHFVEVDMELAETKDGFPGVIDEFLQWVHTNIKIINKDGPVIHLPTNIDKTSNPSFEEKY